MVKVTVYIPTYNYGRFIEKAVDSVIGQTMDDWELIVIDDGSTDNTSEVLARYRRNPKIRIIQQENKGLNVTNNIALRLANGRYITRLDADDWLDENALLILSNILDTKPEIGLVYPDYYEVDSRGDVIHMVRRKKLGEEVELLDLPAHGACTMFRKELLMQIDGYLESFTCQDGYELWLRFIRKFNPYNVNVPLFYYRKHPASLTTDQGRILETRRKIKRRFVKDGSAQIPKVLGFIPATRSSVYTQNDPFVELAGKPLIWYTLNELSSTSLLDRIVVSSEDDEVLEYAGRFAGIEPMKRAEAMISSTMKMKDLIRSALDRLEESSSYRPDAVCTLYVNTPLRRSHHIDKAIDTMVIFDVDSVISVQEELAHCYHHSRYGLEAINATANGMRIERRSIYRENSVIYLTKTEVLRGGRFLGEKIGHIVMPPEESIKINSEYDLWLAGKIISDWRKEGQER
jgi:CMP-N-acetylneuraminic acid synthetase